MNYSRIYNLLIAKRKQNIPSGYTELHHIIPKTLGGSNDKENLVKLTAREHFIAHHLLCKMHPINSFAWYKMNHAFLCMFMCSKLNPNRYVKSRTYERYRKFYAVCMSISQSGSNNSQYNKIWIYNISLRENRKILIRENIPDGWNKGRVINWDAFIEKNNKKALKNKIDERDLFKNYYKSFIASNFTSVNAFSKSVNVNRQTLVKKWKLYIPNLITYKRQSMKITIQQGIPK